jgi:DNA sulfur modification protein DndD
LKTKLSNGATRLPWDLPDQDTMQEMLNDHICKVCGREAPEGSEAYNFMLHKLQEYKQHIEMVMKAESDKKEIQDRELFSQQYVEEMHDLCTAIAYGHNEQRIANYAHDINERFTFVNDMRKKIKETEKEIHELKDEINRLLINAGNISEDQLDNTFENIRGLFSHREEANRRISDLESQLADLKDTLKDLKGRLNALNPESSQALVYKKVHQTLEAVAKAFAEAQQENLNNFLKQLESKANFYLNKLSSEDFHGVIRLVPSSTTSTSIKLFSSNETEILRPSGSQRTVQYISILFAISDYTKDVRTEDYPLIFDAATSSFGDYKEEGFYNVVDKINKQCIIITKDFIDKGEIRMNEINKLTCSVYRIKKDANFDQNDMSTIRTVITKIK